MQPPAGADQSGIMSLPASATGRSVRASQAPSYPQTHAGETPPMVDGLALLKTGDKVRHRPKQAVDANIMNIGGRADAEERAELNARGGFPIQPARPPWTGTHRSTVVQQATGEHGWESKARGNDTSKKK